MKVTFLGTGTSQGVPVIGCSCETCLSKNKKDKRLRSSILIEIENKRIIIDVGPDFRQQMLNAQVDNIDAILLTHEHNDHLIGMDDIRPINFLHNKSIPVYTLTRVQEALKQRFSYIFNKNPYPGAPKLTLSSINASTPFWVDTTFITPIEILHGQLPILGFRIKDFTYITDAKTITSSELEKVKGTKILVLSALHHKEHHSHLSLAQALEWIERIQPEQAFITHISHHMGKDALINPTLPEGVSLAWDGLSLEIIT